MTQPPNDLPASHGASDGHGASDAAGAHGGHDDPRNTHLGPPDVAAWMAGALGALIALLMAACFALAVGAIPTI